jgi:hypothetical protein
MATLAPEAVEEQPMLEVEQQALALPDEARKLRITSADEAQEVGRFVRERCRAVLKEINSFCDPIIAVARETVKTAMAQKERVAAPVREAQGIGDRLLIGWQEEQERLQAEAQRERDRVARELAEAEALNHAQRLQDAGQVAAAEAVISAPIRPVPVVAAAPPPKVKGIAVPKYYSAEVVDLGELVRAAAADERWLNLVAPNQAAINDLARGFKERFQVPGCRLMIRRGVSGRV